MSVVTWLGIGATATFVFTIFESPPTGVRALYGAYMLVVYAIMRALFATWT
ncbi:MAG TPA: hypothetical protein VJK02_11675 [Anaerolineales bacterium]|nr:hypothetical protein [Anaerolineales bacterium]